MGTLHCALENGADLYVNERQKIRHYRVRSTEERTIRRKKKKNAKQLYFTSRGAYVNLHYNYSDVIHSFDWKSAVEHDSSV